MTDAKAIFQAKRHMATYLLELRELLGRDVRSEELMSLEDTQSIQKESNRTPRAPGWQERLSFSDREAGRFTTFAARLEELSAEPVYIWTPRTMTCGLLQPVWFKEVNFRFSFDINTEGILSFSTKDHLNKLLLDFSEETGRGQTLEVEVSGESWSRAKY